MKDLKIYYFHEKTVDGNKFTVSAYIDKNENVIISVALCSKKDNFCRKIGRSVSSGRLVKFINTINHFINSVKGIKRTSIYTNNFEEFKKDGIFSKDYYKGQENKVLYSYIKKLSFLKSNELKREFGL